MLITIDTIFDIGDTVWYLSRRGKPTKGVVRFIDLNYMQRSFNDKGREDGKLRHDVWSKYWIKSRSGVTVIKRYEETPIFRSKEECEGFYNLQFLYNHIKQ